MKRYQIDYITGHGKGEDLVYAENKEQARIKARNKYKDIEHYEIVAVWEHHYLNELVKKGVN